MEQSQNCISKDAQEIKAMLRMSLNFGLTNGNVCLSLFSKISNFMRPNARALKDRQGHFT